MSSTHLESHLTLAHLPLSSFSFTNLYALVVTFLASIALTNLALSLSNLLISLWPISYSASFMFRCRSRPYIISHSSLLNLVHLPFISHLLRRCCTREEEKVKQRRCVVLVLEKKRKM